MPQMHVHDESPVVNYDTPSSIEIFYKYVFLTFIGMLFFRTCFSVYTCQCS